MGDKQTDISSSTATVSPEVTLLDFRSALDAEYERGFEAGKKESLGAEKRKITAAANRKARKDLADYRKRVLEALDPLAEAAGFMFEDVDW